MPKCYTLECSSVCLPHYGVAGSNTICCLLPDGKLEHKVAEVSFVYGRGGC